MGTTILTTALATAVFQTSVTRGVEHQRTADLRGSFASSGIETGYTGSYEFTVKHRRNKDRRLRGGKHDLHLSPLELWTQREISRDLMRQSSLFSSMVDRHVENVIHCGFAHGVRKKNPQRDAIQTVWRDFTEDCDSRGLFHFWDVIDLSESSEVRDGDVFLFLNPDADDGYGSVMLIEGDRVLTPTGYSPPAGHGIWNGILYRESDGRALRVFVAREAPQWNMCDDSDGRWYEVFDKYDPAAGGIVISLWPRRYTGSRGEPWFSTVIREHDDIDGALVAVRVALRQAAIRATYTKVSDPDAYLDWLRTNGEDVDASDLMHEPIESWEPGEHQYLNPYEEAGVLDNNMPGSNFAPFMETQLRILGLPAGMPLELLLLDFHKGNFSSQRLALQNAYRRFIRRQKRVERMKVSPAYRFAIARAIEVGDLQDRDDVYEHTFRHPRWPYINPLQDAKADIALNAAGLRSRRQISDERDWDFDATLEELEEEAQLRQPADSRSGHNSPEANGA